MKKNDCKVVQDLMPLVLDRVASDESRRMVEEHMDICPECAKQYDALKAEMPESIREAYEEEQKEFIQAMKSIRQKRCRRRVVAVCLAAVICLTAAFCGMFAYDQLFRQMRVTVDNDLYEISLSRLKDGRIVVTADTSRINFDTSPSSEEYMENGKWNMHIFLAAAPIHPSYDQSIMENREKKWCAMILSAGSLEDIHKICQGRGENLRTIWTQGEEIAAASQEMEDYFSVEGRIDKGTRLAVPEWQ